MFSLFFQQPLPWHCWRGSAKASWIIHSLSVISVPSSEKIMSRFGRKSPRDWGSGMTRLAPSSWLRNLPCLLSPPSPRGATTELCHPPPRLPGPSVSAQHPGPLLAHPPSALGPSFFSPPPSIPHAEPLLGRGQPPAAAAHGKFPPVESGFRVAMAQCPATVAQCPATVAQRPSIFKPRLSFRGLSRFSAASLCSGTAFSGNAGRGDLRLRWECVSLLCVCFYAFAALKAPGEERVPLGVGDSGWQGPERVQGPPGVLGRDPLGDT